MISAKEKASELVNSFLPYSNYHPDNSSMRRNEEQLENAKQCAYITIENCNDLISNNFELLVYFADIKEEISKI